MDLAVAFRRPFVLSVSKGCRTTTHQDSPGYRHDPGHENLFSLEDLNCTARAHSRRSAPTSLKASAPWKIAAKRQAGRSGPPPPWTYAYPIITGTRGSATAEERHPRSPTYGACIG